MCLAAHYRLSICNSYDRSHDSVAGETIPIRLFLGGFDLTPTFREVNKKYSTRYYLSLVLIDEGLFSQLSGPYLFPFLFHFFHLPFLPCGEREIVSWRGGQISRHPKSSPGILVMGMMWLKALTNDMGHRRETLFQAIGNLAFPSSSLKLALVVAVLILRVYHFLAY